jgi:hypothetical protein
VSELAKWFNAVNDAYVHGEASWAFEDGRSRMVSVWADCYSRTGDLNLSNSSTIDYARSKGISLKKRKPIV